MRGAQGLGSQLVHWPCQVPPTIRQSASADNFFIRIEHEKVAGDTESPDKWNVTLDFDIEPTGPISAGISLTDDVISTNFITERTDSAKLVESKLPLLNDALLKAGLKIGNLSARHGLLKKTDNQPNPPFPLLDEKA